MKWLLCLFGHKWEPIPESVVIGGKVDSCWPYLWEELVCRCVRCGKRYGAHYTR